MQLYALYLMVMLYMFRAPLAHHQDFKKTVFAARCRIQLFLILSFVCHVLYLCKVMWVLEWCAMNVLLVVCALSCGVIYYEGWNFNSGNYLFTTDTK